MARTPDEEFEFNRRMADQTSRAEIERRQRETETRSLKNERRIGKLEEHFEAFEAKFDEKIDTVLTALSALQISDMSKEEKAAIRLMAQKFVLQADTDEHNQRRWTRGFALLACTEPVILPLVYKLLGVHIG